MKRSLSIDESRPTFLIFRCRKRVTRLVRRIQRHLRDLETLPSDVDLIAAATDATLKPCIVVAECRSCRLDRFPGGWLFFYWLLIEGPLWVVNMLRKNIEVCVQMIRFCCRFYYFN